MSPKASNTAPAKGQMKAAAPAPKGAGKPSNAITANIQAGAVTPTLQKSEEGAAPMTPKNFRNHPDMENFFRFIYENDLRVEALHIIDEIIVERKNRRRGKASTANA